MNKKYIELLPDLAAFLVVVESGSFVQASFRLGITASAVSKKISKLEAFLSVRLFDRTTRHMKLNDEGAKVYACCKPLLELSRELFELKDFLSHKAQGVVRVSVPKIFSVLFIDKWIPEFLRMYPDLSVRFDFDVDEGGVDFSQADICVRVTDSPPPGLIGRKLFEVRYIPCASPQYIERHGTPAHPADLVAHSCIPLAGNVETERWDFSRQGEFCSTAVTGRYCSNDSEAMLKATFGGVGISCLPSVTAEQAIADGRLCRVLPDWEYTGSSQGMAWLLYQPGRHVSLRLKVMIDYLLVKLLRPSG